MNELGSGPTELNLGASLGAPKPLPSMDELTIGPYAEPKALVPEPKVVLPAELNTREAAQVTEQTPVTHADEAPLPKSNEADISALTPRDIGDIAIKQVTASANGSSEIEEAATKESEITGNVPQQPEVPPQEGVESRQETSAEVFLPETTEAPVVTETARANDKPKYLPPVKIVEKADRTDHYAAAGPHRDVPYLVSDFQQAMMQCREQATFPGESRLTVPEIREVLKIQRGIEWVGSEAGVDIGDRFTQPYHYHVFDKVDDYWNAARSTGIQGIESTSATVQPAAGVLLLRAKNELMTYSIIGHETAHDVSRLRVRPVHDPKAAQPNNFRMALSTGYTQLATRSKYHTHGLTEYVTAMIEDKAMQHADYDRADRGYAQMLALGDGAVYETARKQKTTPHEIENLLIRGALNGDLTGVRLIGESIGRRQLGKLLGLPSHIETDDAIEIAQGLGLPSAVERLQSYGTDESVHPFSWRWPR